MLALFRRPRWSITFEGIPAEGQAERIAAPEIAKFE